MRNRMLNPEFWLDEELASIPFEARLLYQGLWGLCDDHHATFPNRPMWIKAQIFPYDDVDMEYCLSILEKQGKIIKFEVDEQEYFWIKNFQKYQYIKNKSKPKYPQYPNAGEYYPSTTPVQDREEEREREREIKRKREEREISSPTPVLPHTLALSLDDFNDLSDIVVAEIQNEVKASCKQIREKAKKVYLYCKAKDKKYKTPGALLLKACREDFPILTDEQVKKHRETAKALSATRKKYAPQTHDNDRASPVGEKEKNKILEQKKSLSNKFKVKKV